MAEDGALPDHLRCSRTDGRQWRCKRRVMDDMKLCDIHYLQGRHRQFKEKVPESLKLQRKPSKKSLNKEPELEIRAQKVATKKNLLSKPMKRKKSARVSTEALDEALRKMKRKKGNLQLELIRMVLKRDLEKKKKETKKKTSDSASAAKKKKKKTKNDEMDMEEEENSEGELTRELPNGVMAISPAQSPSPRNFGNVGANCHVKVGVDTGVVRRRRFRSKNIEPLPVGTMQLVPSGQNGAKLRRGRRKRCHWCQRSGSLSLIKCSSCQKEFFCSDCVEERCFYTEEEVKMACPVCRGTCTCKDCSANQSKDSESKDSLGENNKVEKILRFHYLICMLLPVLKRINQDQSVELDTEAITKGKKPSEVHIKQAEFGCSEKHCCNNCKTSIVDLHRSCPHCSYILCLSCCRDFCRGSFPGSTDTSISKYSNRRKACKSGDKQRLQKLAKKTSGTHLASPAPLSDWKACNDIGRIYCPPLEFGGCGDSLLDLRHVFPLSWIKDLEVSAEEIVCSYEFPEAFDTSSCCSLCLDMDHKADGIEHLQEAAIREDSNDNYLYYPKLWDVHGDKLEHFQKHWGKGHPVIVRSVLQTTPDLSWDPVVMFYTYLERSIARFENNKDLLEATKCLDWCEVEIGIRQYYMGSLNGRTQTNTCNEMFKLKGWLSSHLFQEQFPAHYAELIHSLPIQEYMNPRSGLLNLAAKLPEEIPKPDLGPCVYISYGCKDELVWADSMTKLCYDSYDVVNILAHTTDAPISTEQLTKIRKLLKKHKAQCQSESSKITTDQTAANKVNGKSSLNGENNEDAGLRNVTGEEMHVRKRVARVSCYSAARSPKNSNMSHDGRYDSDSEASLPCHVPVLSFHASDHRNSVDHIQNSDSYEKRVLSESSGAQWDVFRRQDVPKLIEYLQKHSIEFSHMYGFHKHAVHPILDQCVFLDTTHKMRLKEEFEIEPWTFEQHIGEAVIIPAGCPYQIRNPKSCVHVVLEFVIYTEAKNYPREPAAHVAIRTVRRLLEKQKDKITAVVFCTTTSTDTEVYKRLLPLYFPRDKHEEEVAISKLPADVGDENGETIIDERKIRIKPLPKKTAPKPPLAPVELPVSDVGLLRRTSSYLGSFLDPAFMSLIKDPDQRRKEQWEKTAQAQRGWNCAKMLGFGDLGGPPLSAAEEYSLHSRYLAKANSLNLSEISEMKIVYRGGVDSEGRPVMVVVGAHFLLRCLDLERFVLYVVKEFEPLIQKPYTIVYFHSAASLQSQPDLGWMRRLQQILGRKHQRNLHAIYVLHPTFGLKAAIFALQLLVDNAVWKKVVYVDRLLQLFRYVPREQLTIPDFVFHRHDLEVNGGKGLIVDPRTKYVYHRP